MGKTALITGITGQDGSYLAELLLAKGYTVYGIIRRASTFNTRRIDHLYQDPHDEDYRLRLVYADMTDATSLLKIITEARPDEIYNLAAQSHVKVSFDAPEYTGDVDALGALRLLEAVRAAGLTDHTRIYQAGTSEMFGDSPAPQNEQTRFAPRSPYAAAKVYAYHVGRNYREAYDMFVANGILFNHESPRRGPTFVTRKITLAVANIKQGKQDKVFLGNLGAQRDWGFAPDYVAAMHAMLQTETAGDFVIGTGEAHSVQDFAEAAFAHVGLDWRDHVETDDRYLRPTEVDLLRADAKRSVSELRFQPSVDFAQLVATMVDHDMDVVREGRDPFVVTERHFT